MSQTLTKADFVVALPFSPSIEEAQVRPYVADARRLDLLPLLGHETLERLDRVTLPTTVLAYNPAALPGINPAALPAALPVNLLATTPATGAAYALGDVVSRWGRLYRALVPAPSTAPPVLDKLAYTLPAYVGTYPADPTPEADGNWQFLRLETLWVEYLKPYWLRAAYVRFLQNHGVNVTKSGLTVPIDRAQGTYDRPSGGQVASVLHEAQTNAETERARLTRFLRFSGMAYYYDGETGHGGYWLDGYGRGCGAEWDARAVNPNRASAARSSHTASKGRFRAR